MSIRIRPGGYVIYRRANLRLPVTFAFSYLPMFSNADTGRSEEAQSGAGEGKILCKPTRGDDVINNYEREQRRLF